MNKQALRALSRVTDSIAEETLTLGAVLILSALVWYAAIATAMQP